MADTININLEIKESNAATVYYNLDEGRTSVTSTTASATIINGTHANIPAEYKVRATSWCYYDSSTGKYKYGFQEILLCRVSGSEVGDTEWAIGETTGTPSVTTSTIQYDQGIMFSSNYDTHNFPAGEWKQIIYNKNLNSANSTNEATRTVTFNATLGLAMNRGILYNYQATINIKVTIRFKTLIATKYLYYKHYDGSSAGSETGWFGKTIPIKGADTRKSWTERVSSSDEGQSPYTVTFDPRSGVVSPTSKTYTWSWSRPYTYEFKSWGGYAANSSYTFKDTKTLTAQFDEIKGGRSWNWKTFGTPPTAYKKGYFTTKEWFREDNGNQVNNSDYVTSSFTVFCKWENPRTYMVSFDLDGGKIPEGYTKEKLSKVYGVKQTLPPWTPTKVGWKFKGWTDLETKTVAVQMPGDEMDDRVFNFKYNHYTYGPVTLVAKWEVVPNKMIFNYFTLNSSGTYTPHTEELSYNITQDTFRKDSPAYINEMSKDYAFLGWCDILPNNYGWAGAWADPSLQGYHGIYTLPTEAPDSQSPIEVDITKLKKESDWEVAPKQYYGIWSKTGKYVFITGEFKQVSIAYIKITDEEGSKWRPITDMWICVDEHATGSNKWKHEI